MANSELINISSMADPSILDNIYTLENNITEGKNLLTNYSLASINTTLEKMKKIKETPTTKLTQAFGEVQKYTDASVEGTQVGNTEIYDVWILNKNYCPDGYNYISKTSSSLMLVFNKVYITYSNFLFIKYNNSPFIWFP